MKALRFRVTLDSEDEIYREIDILPGHTLEDFHKAILQAFGFDQKHQASFFYANDGWIKGEEFVLRPEDSSGDKKIMKKFQLSEVIFDPHQKFIYLYDYEKRWVFFIELLRLTDIKPGKEYPMVFKSIGDAPKQYPRIPKPKSKHDDSLAELLGIDTEDLMENKKKKSKTKSAPDEDDVYKIFDEDEMFDEEEWEEMNGEEDEDNLGLDEDDLQDGFGEPDDYR